jgi:hypothetical protein
MSNEIAIKQATPMVLIDKLIEKGGDMSQLEKLMDMQMRWEANEAKKAYVRAMTEFKSNAPTITKTKRVQYQSQKGKVDYMHAELSQIASQVAAEMSKHGLSHSWKTEQTNNVITVTCVITHAMGHSESVSLQATPDQSGGKNDIQAVGSTVSYLQRYTLLSACGLAAGGIDDDARTATREPEQVLLVGEIEIKEIEEAAKAKGVNIETIKKAYGVVELSEIAMARFAEVLARINNTGKK